MDTTYIDFIFPHFNVHLKVTFKNHFISYLFRVFLFFLRLIYQVLATVISFDVSHILIWFMFSHKV